MHATNNPHSSIYYGHKVVTPGINNNLYNSHSRENHRNHRKNQEAYQGWVGLDLMAETFTGFYPTPALFQPNSPPPAFLRIVPAKCAIFEGSYRQCSSLPEGHKNIFNDLLQAVQLPYQS